MYLMKIERSMKKNSFNSRRNHGPDGKSEKFSIDSGHLLIEKQSKFPTTLYLS